jgi:hypothetical protein
MKINQYCTLSICGHSKALVWVKKHAMMCGTYGTLLKNNDCTEPFCTELAGKKSYKVLWPIRISFNKRIYTNILEVSILYSTVQEKVALS